MKKKKETLGPKNPSGHVPHVIDWDRVSVDMKRLIDDQREIYCCLVDGDWLKDFPGDDHYGLD